MAMAHLGPGYDLNVGGVDLRFPHHENSRALAAAATGKELAGSGFTRRTSWSTGRRCPSRRGTNTRSTTSRAGRRRWKGVLPAEFRYYCMTLHYATPMNFTWEGQAAAAKGLARLREAFRKAAGRATAGADTAGLRDRFRAALSDDLNLPRALSVAHDAARSGIGGDAARSLAAEWDRVLRVGLPGEPGASAGAEEVPAEIAALARERDAARRDGDFSAADSLRSRIRSMGYDVVDAGKGVTSVRRSPDAPGGTAKDGTGPGPR
jgi:cysteinyl-tRNA synthetase